MIFLLGFRFDYWNFYGGLTAPSPPVESTAAEDQNQNNDYKDGFNAHDFSPFSLIVYYMLFNSIPCAKICVERKDFLRL
jgi:hypothetical protein